MTEQDADHIGDVLRASFGGHVEREQIAPGRFRFALVSPRFAEVSHLRRQDQVWEVIDANVDREVAFDISLLLTFAPGETQIDTDVPQT